MEATAHLEPVGIDDERLDEQVSQPSTFPSDGLAVRPPFEESVGKDSSPRRRDHRTHNLAAIATTPEVAVWEGARTDPERSLICW